MRPVDDLIHTPDPAWPVLEAELAALGPAVEVLPVDPEAGRACLHRLQVTARSRLGALALHTGGRLVDGGWLRVLGGGSPERGLPSLAEANGLPGDGQPPAALLVGHDVLGGRFEVSGADPAAIGRPGEPGEVCYFAPDSLEWEELGCGHGAWLSWIAAGGTAEFYESQRWPGWRAEVEQLPASHGLAVYPFLWSSEAHDDLAATARRPAPLRELFAIQDEAAAFLAADPDAEAVRIDVR
ncbi:DUF2625 family protein [Plantactinospora sp. BB1]|uniref:DUF2625 family protein n=1 Tax=Plantactinospora sp. BB1 TaxID=2071627 RepID=UPI000D17AC9A|nr:DUF2625 family protein [Plantactinospora sp. BB1]AVT35572.1 hypothetical protein C6W10_02860 [Plantactinospora sp. BB1]